MHAKIDDSPEGLKMLLKGGTSEAEPSAPDGDGELPEGMMDAAHDLVHAVHGGKPPEGVDHKAVAHALHNAHSICSASKKD